MDDNGRVHSNCVNASNPYHECGVACFEKVARGQGQGQVRMEKKKSDFRSGIKDSGLSKKVNGVSKKFDGERRADPNCPKGSNPYHQCDKSCTYTAAEVEASPRVVNKESGSFILDAPLSFGRKKKGSESQPRSPRDNVSAVKALYAAETVSSQSSFSNKKKVESENGQSSSSGQHSEESYSQDHSFDKGQVQSTEIVHTSGNLKPNGSKGRSIDSLTCFAIAPPIKHEDDEKLHASPETASSPIANNVEVKSGPGFEGLNFTFSGISHVSDESDDEIQSVISESCVSVGKYHVRSNVATILQLILEKHGDIAANCQLESTSLRAYYLECLCSVVQELQSSSPNQLTKSKVKELLAVLKDVGSAQIDVSWLRSILNGLTDTTELNNQQLAAKEAKTNCDYIIESTRKELESMLEDLAKKEKAVADTKAQIDETKVRLSELELESSHLSKTISSIQSKVDKFHSKSWAEIL